MKSGLYSYLIPLTGDLWDSIQSAPCEVDHLPGFTVEMVEILIDYLRTDCRISLPGPEGPNAVGNCVAVACLTSHEANVLRTRIVKIEASAISEILALYGKSGVGGDNWAAFLARQSTHFTSDEQRLVLVVTVSSPLVDNAPARG